MDMENQLLSSKIRNLAMLCHLAGLSWTLISIFFFVWVILSDSVSWVWYFALFLWPLLAIILATTSTLIIWVFTINSHPFVRKAAQSVNNFMLSCSVYLAGLMIMSIATCGIARNSSILVAIFSNAVDIAIFLDLCFLLFHSCLIIHGAILAQKGQSYEYPITTKFLNNP
jgi:uncharacterized Tic20 family protein